LLRPQETFEFFFRKRRVLLSGVHYARRRGDVNANLTEVAFWAHARRKLFDAQSSDVMRSVLTPAYPAMARLLYDVERESKEIKLRGDGRLALPLAKSVRILDDIEAYLQREQPNVLPKSREGQAISYTLSNWDALMRCCEQETWR
jgi:hypothetical protein